MLRVIGARPARDTRVLVTVFGPVVGQKFPQRLLFDDLIQVINPVYMKKLTEACLY